jgi:enoyl-CoA hydratase/carnithine racemase
MRSINNELLVLLKMGLVNETVEPQALSAADKLIAQEQKNKRKTAST